jgi:hypothetical protein
MTVLQPDIPRNSVTVVLGLDMDLCSGSDLAGDHVERSIGEFIGR